MSSAAVAMVGADIYADDHGAVTEPFSDQYASADGEIAGQGTETADRVDRSKLAVGCHERGEAAEIQERETRDRLARSRPPRHAVLPAHATTERSLSRRPELSLRHLAAETARPGPRRRRRDVALNSSALASSIVLCIDRCTHPC